MQKKLFTTLIAFSLTTALFAQSETKNPNAVNEGENAFTFTEAQLGEDDDINQTISIVSSNNNIYANETGYLFSPVRFRYRAYNTRYNDIYINGVQMNNNESGQFNYSMVGGLNSLTRDMESSLPFESNEFSMSGLGGSNNYNFRASHFAAGNRLTVSGANRNYTLRGMYTYSTGLSNKGWAFTGSVAYRWANRGYIEGTFYNSLSYFVGVEKVFNANHSLSFSTWGNPTERASQGAATDESYWLANSNFYNPYWGYQNGKVRNSRIVNDFAPTALLTWDWTINKTMKLTTSVAGKYSTYSSTKLNYNNADNPQPDYWKNLPSSYYDVWDVSDTYNRTAQNLADWNSAYDYARASKSNRQINWDQLYYANKQASAQGYDAMYYVQAKHNDQFSLNLSSILRVNLTKNSTGVLGYNFSTTTGKHYQTMDDLLGASVYHNINTYALGTYSTSSDQVQYDMNNRNGIVKEGDKFGYNYNLLVNKASAWATYTIDEGIAHSFISARVGGTEMQRDGKMRNGMAADNSYGKSGTAHFLDGGVKFGTNINIGGGSTIVLGIGSEAKAPTAMTAFASPEINNDFVLNLKNERIFSSELGYAFQTSWLHANINGYYTQTTKGTEWQNFYFDDINSFSYVSMTNIEKKYYGVELGMIFKVSSALDVQAIGTWSDAKNTNNANVRYMNSTKGTYTDDVVMNKNMHESGTPLSAYSLGLSYHSGGWYIDLDGNYYDRIYLSYSPNFRYQKTLKTMGNVDNNGNYIVPEQAKGKGGFMLDASIGRSIYLKKGSLSVNLMLSNILNNTKLCTGGYEQSRSDYTVNTDGTLNNVRAYKFSRNPKKFYANGINGMLNIAYKF
jgi:hypothetical protein